VIVPVETLPKQSGAPLTEERRPLFTLMAAGDQLTLLARRFVSPVPLRVMLAVPMREPEKMAAPVALLVMVRSVERFIGRVKRVVRLPGAEVIRMEAEPVVEARVNEEAVPKASRR